MRSGFFNSTITGYDEQGQPIFDRAEDASFFAKYFSQFVGNGVFALPADGLMVQAEEGMAVTVKAGTCFINGYMGWLEQDQQLSVSASSETFARIDRVVVRYDAVQRGIDLFILQGTPAASPVPPSITQHAQGDIYELALADIMVNRNASALRQADITDLRLNEAVCGVVASPVEHLETGAANAQLTDAFNQWFEGIKGQLSEDAAGNLQNQIDAHTGDTDVHITTAERAQWNKGIEKDFIVEQGVSGMWTYRKWNSGIAECWGKLSPNCACYQCMGFWECHEIRLGPGSFFSVCLCKRAKLHDVAARLSELFPTEPSGRGNANENFYTSHRIG